jgi:hypothetical protein
LDDKPKLFVIMREKFPKFYNQVVHASSNLAMHLVQDILGAQV